MASGHNSTRISPFAKGMFGLEIKEEKIKEKRSETSPIFLGSCKLEKIMSD